MKKDNTDTQVTKAQEGELINLRPSEIQAHPTIKFLEENGIFPIGSADIDKMTQSVASMGYLQPIVVTNIDGTYYRIIGRRRTMVAEKLGMTVPCYVRDFATDDDIIEAWKTENFVRAHYTTIQMLKETEKIQHIWSRRTKNRVEKAQKCCPEMQKLIEKGVFQMRTDEDIIGSIGALPVEIQKAIVSGFENSTVVKTEYKNKIKKVVLDPELKEQIEEQIERIENLQQELAKKEKSVAALKVEKKELEKTLETHGNDSAEIKRLLEVNARNTETQRKELMAKDKEISDLKIQQHKAHEDLIQKIQNIFSKQTKHIYQLATRLTKETDATINLLKDEISGLDQDDPARKEHLLVIQDSLNKAKDAINKKFEAISKVISDNLIKIDKASNN